MAYCVIVTGASGGLGKAIVDEFLSCGDEVIGIDVKESNLHGYKNFHEMNFCLLDFINDPCLRTWFADRVQELSADCSKLILINNAALQIVKPLLEANADEINNSLNINAVAPLYLVKTIHSILAMKSGHVINLTSVHTELSKKNFGIYSTSKALLRALTKALALDLADSGIKVNSISPAALDTEMLREGFDYNLEKLSELESYHPVKKIGDPKKLASLISSICKLNDVFLSGSEIKYDGCISFKLHDPVD